VQGAAIAKFEVVTKQAVEAASPTEARQQIVYDLDMDSGAHDDDLVPVEDGVGDMIIKEVESHDERITQFPRAMAGY
jgi:hypothetical protein